ncbi:class I SAM-dependent methyltransferase [Candidatus Bathyarchaeota archaeon]|nr:MAG: class I SAM-dependent methyltransferase [Candidatus Bathyarchaeota archaeon]
MAAKFMTAHHKTGMFQLCPELGPGKKGMKINASGPEQLVGAWAKYYDRLAGHFLSQIGQRKFRTILEAGCGKGQLTIPLLRRVPNRVEMIAVDSSRGPYSGWLDELGKALRKTELGKRVRLIRSDAKRIRGVEDESVDIIVSNELLCDLPYDSQLEKALGEFYRILRPRGFMIHGEWSSSPAVEPQAFLVKHWPSWTPDQLFAIMRRVGFDKFQVTYFGTTIHFGYVNAIKELRGWGATETLLKRYDKLLKRKGIELPFEHVVQCQK